MSKFVALRICRHTFVFETTCTLESVNETFTANLRHVDGVDVVLFMRTLLLSRAHKATARRHRRGRGAGLVVVSVGGSGAATRRVAGARRVHPYSLRMIESDSL